MITGKVVAGYQWSGDAVYTMDQADKDEFTLNFAVPKESSNIYFDGWVMLKSGIGGNDEKKQAAQSFTDNSGNSTAVASGFEYNYKEQVAENI